MNYPQGNRFYSSKKSILFLFLIMLFMISIISRSPFIPISLLNIFILIIFPSKNIVLKIYAFIYSIMFSILVEGNIVSFNFIPQAENLIKNNPNIIYWFSVNNPHAIRLLLAYPGFLLSQIYKIDLNMGFSYFISILFTLIYVFIVDTVCILHNKKNIFLPYILAFVALVPLFMLPFIMNGRLVMAYLGFIILIRLFLVLINNKPISYFKIIFTWLIGFTLTTVSSGTMSIAFFYSLFWICSFLKEKKVKDLLTYKFISLSILMLPVIYLIVSYFWMMLMRNVNFFGGGFIGAINMLTHGAGKFLIFNGINNTFLIVLLFLGTIIITINIIYLKRAFLRNYLLTPILTAINISLYGFLFGFSAGSMMIPAVIILVLLKV